MDDDKDDPSTTNRRSLLALFTVIATTLYHVAADDAAVMAKLAASLSSKPSGWSGNDPCKWSGVQCSGGKVTDINLMGRSISGEIPPDFSQLSSLKDLSLQRNQLSGALPPFSDMPMLTEVHLDDNNFTSVPPGFLSGLTSLSDFSIDKNPNLPPWTLPKTLTDSSAIQRFSADGANLAGPLPDIFESFPSLQFLRLSYNNLTGPLPASLGKSGIQTLILNNQAVGLSGRIDVIGKMTQLQQAWLHVNAFSGPIPDLSGLGSVFDLQLRDNHLTGVVPESLSKLPRLANLTLQNNKLQGPVPTFPDNVQVNLGKTNSFCNTSPGPCDPRVTILLKVVSGFGYPFELAESWKGNDPCTDWDGITCSNGGITVINFGKRSFTGIISPAIANITSLRTIILSDNKLYGTIPASLTGLPQLQLLDISNNNISGKIPTFASTVTLKTSGNTYIGQDVAITPTDGSPSSAPDSLPSSDSPSGNKASVFLWVIVAVVIVVVIVCSIIIYKFYMRKSNGKYEEMKDGEKGKEERFEGGQDLKSYGGSESSEIQSQSSKSNNDLNAYDGGNFAVIAYEVLREVTNNFSEENVLGRGGFGIVYRGQLHDGTLIAVKRMEASLVSTKGLNEFKAEIEVLTKVRHRHLVGLHGFCENGNERLLVYEYMPKGTLAQHLFRHEEMKFPPLSWKQRVTIALDVARGVEYLHSLARQSFIHRDLKPTNVLLGDDMRAKVSDFGLVKSAPDGKYSVETRLAGTFGYLAPEYAATGRVTTKVDVFAFGVILMEMITGRKALEDTLPEEKIHLESWFRRILADKEAIRNSLDPLLNPDDQTFGSICKVAELAGHCTAREPYQRPDMCHAVNVLSPLVETWTPAKSDDRDSFGIDLDMSLPQALQRWKTSDNNNSSTVTGGYDFTATFSNNTPKMDSTGSFTSRDDGQ